jgi:P pilus assembly chaperone PapD
MEPQERRIIRIGAKVNTKGRELCYRLYVEELPEFEFGRRIPIFDEEGEEKQNMNVRMLTRFGIPIFLQPKKKILKGDIEKVFLENKRLKILISNKGNINFSPKNIKIAFINNRNRKEISSDIERWYLLSGAKRWYEIEIPKKVFIDNATIMEVEVKTNKFIFEKRLEKYFTKISY